ncbi:MAG: GWxTD domain-containing protein [Candidatus Zixiibacteriota bacterium]
MSFSKAFPEKKNSWKEWLREVEPIITKDEKDVFLSLKTEEDRTRFVNLFWKVRDPNPETRENEYKVEFYERLKYVNRHLGGSRSDQGRIYMILGEPAERNNYGASGQVVECEVWTYYKEGRPGLPPVMNLVFYRRENIGKYHLFYPGIDTPLDILSPGHRHGREDPIQAYNEIRQSFPELADATLSVIPGEGAPGLPATATSSSHVFAQIYTLPEKEASDSYLRGFHSVKGIVDVTYSFKEMPGTVTLAVSENRGYRFLNYSVLPDVIHIPKITDNLYSAKLNLNLRIEDMDGKTIYQRERKIDLKLSDVEKKTIERKKVMFSDFVPIIDGVFKVSIVFSNRTTEEFLIHEEKIELNDKTVPVLLGFKANELQSDRFMPFSTDKHKISFDPRHIYNKTDSLEAIVFTENKPDVFLTRVEDETDSIEIQDVVQQGSYFIFKQPLVDLKSSHYYLSVRTEDGEVYRKIIAVLPFLADKPRIYEWSDAPTSGPAYNFEIAIQYLNSGNVHSSLEYFNKLPENLWNSVTIPIIAKAYYQNKNYEKVVELLERENVTKNYSVLFLLGNSSLELKQLKKAAEYFEQLRNYGDTVKLNQVLGAIFLSLGEREKAKVYFDRAKELENRELLPLFHN